MAKRKPEMRIRSWGIYTAWDKASKQLPKLLEITTEIPAEIDIEFGLIVNVKRARNMQVHYSIDHPGILDANGERRPPFDGSVYVRTNDWDFFLGDSIWEPLHDKVGQWNLSVSLEDTIDVTKAFNIATS